MIIPIGIRERTLQELLTLAKESHPREFAAILRANSKTKVITEFLVLPGTLSSSVSALLRLEMLHADFNLVGTYHSHPSGLPLPSRADLIFFEKFGIVHIIVAYPYDMKSWKAYDFRGNSVHLKVLSEKEYRKLRRKVLCKEE